mmetsp:Transcript_1227/g.2485  ORF Transcript_1227/g.2485 Transcript_1227/m.2485 type:complete len:304 (-) Transcript_1227:23-934(-)
MAPTIDDSNGEKDIKWTDAQIRWPEDKAEETGDNDNSEDYNHEETPFDLFADPDPHEIFHFRFVTKKDENDDESIRLEIHGYKTDSDQVWESTGLTLWKASKYLCDYMVLHADALRGQRVLELGAGLGLNGVLAHRLGADSVVITDGDSDAMVELRKNIAVNRIQNDEEKTLSAAQLIWGLESSEVFLDIIAKASSSSQFSIIIASDVIYAPIVIDPLFETVRTLLQKPNGEFWMAFAVRKVPVKIDFVLQKARDHGFRYELVDEQIDGGGNGEDDVEGNPETGPVFIYKFRWDAEGAERSAT